MFVRVNMLGFLLLSCFLSSTSVSAQNDTTTATPDPGDGTLDQFSWESKLLHDILENITADETFKFSRPVQQASQVMDVEFSIRIKQILAFDAIEQILTLFAWKTMVWQNDHLKWDASLYADIATATIEGELAWLPDIILLNAVSTELTADRDLDVIVVQNDGMMRQSLPYIFKMPCPVDMRNFPFDIQECHFDFGSWMYGKDELELKADKLNNGSFMDITEHIPNQEWLIVANDTTISNVRRGPAIFRVVTCKLSLERFAGFYVQFVLIPTLLLATLILTIFWIPPSRPDRTGLGMSVFAGLMLLLLMVVQISPPSTNVKIGNYYCVNIVLVVFSTVISAAVVALSNKNKPMAPKIRNFFVKKVGRWTMVTQQYEVMYPTDDDENPKATAIRDWQILAVVLDRMFFIIYAIVVIISISLFFPFPTSRIRTRTR